MTATPNLNENEILTALKRIDDNVLKLSSILEKFGLDIITKLGQSQTGITMLRDQVEKLTAPTIEIKGLLPQLNIIISEQKKMEGELDLIKSLLQKATKIVATPKMESTGKDNSKIDSKTQIDKLFLEFKEELDTCASSREISERLSLLKSDIFEITGGHKVLYEILQTINKVKEENASLEASKKFVLDKIAFWNNRI